MKQLLIFFILFIMAFGIDLKVIDPSDLDKDEIIVNVSGEVSNPGPVTAEPYITVKEILEIAEPTNEADLDTLNPDMVLNDHDILVVPKKRDKADPPRISINNSTLEDLTMLPGIGPAIAQRILDYRNEHGLFQSTEELLNVPGIGKAKYDAISDQIML